MAFSQLYGILQRAVSHIQGKYMILKTDKKRGNQTMSQEKVNRYKEEKANRKEIMAKEKRKNTMMKICAGVIALALVGWLGYSVYDMATRPDTSAVKIDASALDEYLDSVGAE